MAEHSTQTQKAVEAKQALACRLRQASGLNGLSSSVGEVELENCSAESIEIQISMHPLQFLKLVISDLQGKPVPAKPYGNLFSPREKPYTFRLSPGEKFRHNISLPGNVPEDCQKPGIYVVQAVYEYNGLRAISDPLRVHVPSKGS